MRLYEILQNRDLLDTIKFPVILQLDKLYDDVEDKSYNFSRPAWDMNIDLLIKWVSLMDTILEIVGSTQLPAMWTLN